MKGKTLFLLLALAATVALAQGRGRGPMFSYDPSTEATITGTIEEINTTGAMCRSGSHVIVKTDKGNLEVALGPNKFLADQNLNLKKGDQVQIVGAKATTGRGEIFIAREITSAGKTVTLRDAQGVPSWPRGMCQ